MVVSALAVWGRRGGVYAARAMQLLPQNSPGGLSAAPTTNPCILNNHRRGQGTRPTAPPGTVRQLVGWGLDPTGLTPV